MKTKGKKAFWDSPFEVLKGLKVAAKQTSLEGQGTVEDDETLFLREMQGVVPLPERPNRFYPLYPKNASPPPYFKRERSGQICTWSEDLRIDMSYEDGFVEACAPVVSKEIMIKLREGRFSYQAYIDLHGLTKEAAEIELRKFILRCYSLGMRCVLIVHGKGYNSKENTPVLKEMVPLWLSKSPLRRIVLAFCSARPYDGGTGALYVLLRRWRVKRPK